MKNILLRILLLVMVLSFGCMQFHDIGGLDEAIQVKISGDTRIKSIIVSDISDAVLQTINAVEGALTYDATVDNVVSSVKLIINKIHSTGTVDLNDEAISMGVSSKVIPLSVGTNSVKVVVKAVDSNSEYIIRIHRKYSGNLLNITLSSGSLTPAFNKDVREYSVRVNYSVGTLNINCTKQDGGGLVKYFFKGVTYTGNSYGAPLEVGDNVVTITPVEADGVQSTYTLNIYRENNAYLSSLSLTDGTLNPVFNQSTLTYNVSVDKSTASTRIKAVKQNNGGLLTLKINDGSTISLPNDTYSSNIPLNIGNNKIEVTITETDGAYKIYTVNVLRNSAVEDSYLENLVISNGAFTPIFTSSGVTYTVSVAGSVESVTFTPTLKTAESEIFIQVGTSTDWNEITNGSSTVHQYLTMGENKLFKFKVVAEDGVLNKIYSVTVKRLSNNADISSIIISDSTLTTTFSKYTTTYDCLVNYGVTSVKVTGVRDQEFASMSYALNDGEPVSLPNDTESSAIGFVPPTATLEVIGKAEDGTEKTYTINLKSRSETPIFSPDQETFADSLVVTLTVTDSNDVVYYTTDGNEPTVYSTLYTAPFTINGDLNTIKAMSKKTGYQNSLVATKTYRKEYQVTFNTQGGAAVDPQTIGYGLAITQPDPLVKDGYTFDGWFTEQECTNEWNFLINTVSGAMTLYAKWGPIKYSIIYNLNGGVNNETNPVEYTADAETIILSEATKTGYTFDGWYQNVDMTGDAVTEIIAGSVGDVEVWARWINVIFDKQGGTGGSGGIIAVNGSAMPTATAPTKDGYAFAGYWDALEGGVQYYNVDMTSAANWDKTESTTLYARWGYLVTFDKQGGSGGYDSVVALYGSAMPMATAPTRDGYEFIGYYDAVSGGNKYYNADMTSARNWDKTINTTIYAQWTKVYRPRRRYNIL